jgi:ribosomal protein S12 methylthiotransferase accessory factor YcaO
MTIESTTRLVAINGVPARVWQGTSERGVPVVCCITRIAVAEGDDNSQFEAELKEHAAPTPAVRVFDLVFFVDVDEDEDGGIDDDD